jgi:hypothetical protein
MAKIPEDVIGGGEENVIRGGENVIIRGAKNYALGAGSGSVATPDEPERFVNSVFRWAPDVEKAEDMDGVYLAINFDGDRHAVTFLPDGQIRFSPCQRHEDCRLHPDLGLRCAESDAYVPTEAARVFWESIAAHNPMRARVEQMEKSREASGERDDLKARVVWLESTLRAIQILAKDAPADVAKAGIQALLSEASFETPPRVLGEKS